MLLRIISDIHCDININDEIKYDFGNDFVICCGDISGDRFKTAEWIKKYIKRGIVVAGNHLGYNWISGDEEDTLDNSIKYLQNEFSDEPIYFLENQHIEIDNVIFIGCILFTDFNLYNDELLSRMTAYRSMNDYRYVKILKYKKVKLMSPDEQIIRHKRSKKYIENICKKNPDKKIVVITHHAPSEQSIEYKYKNDLLSSAFASNLESLIEKYPNIKLWCHGHVHHVCDYKVFDTRIVANPRGYRKENIMFKSNGIIIDTNEL